MTDGPKHDPPGWERPNPVPIPSGPQFDGVWMWGGSDPVGCDRCGAVVNDWDKHADWHANMASGIATLTGAVTLVGVPEADWTPAMREQVKWVVELAEA